MFQYCIAEPTFRDRSLSFIPGVFTPWHLMLLAFILIALPPMLKLRVACKSVLGLLDQAIYQLVLNHLLTDPF
jgi:hypothetical protein